MKTYSAKSEEVKRAWWVIDASGQPLGRVAEKAANLLRGKNKTIFTPHVDTGDFVVVLNASKVTVGGKKRWRKSIRVFPAMSAGTIPKLSRPGASGIPNFWSNARSAG